MYILLSFPLTNVLENMGGLFRDHSQPTVDPWGCLFGLCQAHQLGHLAFGVSIKGETPEGKGGNRKGRASLKLTPRICHCLHSAAPSAQRALCKYQLSRKWQPSTDPSESERGAGQSCWGAWRSLKRSREAPGGKWIPLLSPGKGCYLCHALPRDRQCPARVQIPLLTLGVSLEGLMGSGAAGQGSYRALARPPTPSLCPGRVLLEAPNTRVGAKHATWRLRTSFNLCLRCPVYIPGARPSAGSSVLSQLLGTPEAGNALPREATAALPDQSGLAGAQLGRSAGQGWGSEEAIRGLRTLSRTGTLRTLDEGPGRAPQAAIASGLSKPPFSGIQREHKLTRNSSAASSGRGRAAHRGIAAPPVCKASIRAYFVSAAQQPSEAALGFLQLKILNIERPESKTWGVPEGRGLWGLQQPRMVASLLGPHFIPPLHSGSQTLPFTFSAEQATSPPSLSVSQHPFDVFLLKRISSNFRVHYLSCDGMKMRWHIHH